LKAAVADYIVAARRKGTTWYVGAMTDATPRKLEVSLDFLSDGAYTMTVMKDGINADRYAQDYKREVKPVDKSGRLVIDMASGGGFAAILSE
jgi:alpha-glucosidase